MAPDKRKACAQGNNCDEAIQFLLPDGWIASLARTDVMTSRTATLIGLTAILMWSLLAALTVATGKIPAFQLAAMTFAIGALAGFLRWIGRPDAVRALRQSPIAW